MCAFTTRRAGKSTGFAYKFFRKALKYENVMMPFIALTRDSAKNIMWTVLQEVAEKEKLECEFKDSDLTCKVVGGGHIKLFGADMKNFLSRLRGIKTPLAVIDEAQGFRSHIEGLVDDVLTPAISDYSDGQLAIAGTPGPVPKGYFYDVTTGKKGFSIHTWSAFKNPYIKAEAFVNDLMLRKQWTWEHPTLRREWLGEWVADDDALVYKFDETKNRASSLPDADYTYVIGVDLGYDPDPTAFAVGAYSAHDHHLYIVETMKQTKMIISDVAERIKYLLKKYPGSLVTVDAADKQAVEEMKQRFGLHLIAAEKHGKAGFIELMNSDMRLGHVKVVSGDDLIEEWSHLIWDSDSERRQEDSRYANHLADACLYLWRYAYNYLAVPAVKPISRDSEEYVDNFWENEANKKRTNKHVLET